MKHEWGKFIFYECIHIFKNHFLVQFVGKKLWLVNFVKKPYYRPLSERYKKKRKYHVTKCYFLYILAAINETASPCEKKALSDSGRYPCTSHIQESDDRRADYFYPPIFRFSKQARISVWYYSSWVYYRYNTFLMMNLFNLIHILSHHIALFRIIAHSVYK